MRVAVNGITSPQEGEMNVWAADDTLLMIPCELDDEDLGVRNGLFLPVI